MTGNYYLRARYYDPSIGRFTQEDTHWNVGNMVYDSNGSVSLEAILQSGNLYAYCGSNPVNRRDPTGKWFVIDDIVTGPVDEIVVLAVLAILAAVGVKWAQSLQTQINAGIMDLVDAVNILISKSSKKSNKERATDKPSWVNKGDINSSKSAEENAKRLLDDKYGDGNWKKGPGSEYNQIKKWLNRDLGLSQIIPDSIDDSIRPEDMATARWMAGSYIINDVSNKNFGWVDGYYGFIPHIYNDF